MIDLTITTDFHDVFPTNGVRTVRQLINVIDGKGIFGGNYILESYRVPRNNPLPPEPLQFTSTTNTLTVVSTGSNGLMIEAEYEFRRRA